MSPHPVPLQGSTLPPPAHLRYTALVNRQNHIKAAVAAAFSAAAETYDAAAGLQRGVAGELAARIARLPLKQPRVLEIGCGTGFLSEALLGLNPREVLLTDIAPAMIDRCRKTLPADAQVRFAVLDGEHPEDAGGDFDLICSSMTFQWFADLEGTLARLCGQLAPGGALAFATLAEGSFPEWRAAHDDLGLAAATRSYPSAAELRSMLPGLSVEEEHLTRRYANGHAFVAHLKKIGAHLPEAGRRPLGAGALRSVLRQFARGIDVTYHVAYGTWTKS